MVDLIWVIEPCRDCDNLSYWDDYFCSIHDNFSKDCRDFKVRVGSNYDFCRDMPKCVFWCNQCEGYQKNS